MNDTQIIFDMTRLHSNKERWDFMCDNCSASQCDRVKARAERKWPDFGPPEITTFDGIICSVNNEISGKTEQDRKARWRMAMANDLKKRGNQQDAIVCTDTD